MNISFDYDVLTSDNKKELLEKKAVMYIVSAVQDKMTLFKVAYELSIPFYRVYATGSKEAKLAKIKELDISEHYDYKNNVKKKIQYESYTDYPKQAVENAKVALRWAEENGWGDCGTPVGKARANQLANNKPISEDTISRMASFERQRQNSERPLGEGCGRLMWLAWGGDAGIEWASRKLKQIRLKEGVDHYTKDGKLYTGPTHKDATGKLMTGAEHSSDSQYLYHIEDL